jgi:KilA-N domain
MKNSNTKSVKSNTLKVENFDIVFYSQNSLEYISLTDMARYRDSERTNYIIQNWLRTRNAIEFCGLWEQINNPNFKSIEFDAFKTEAGANSFALTPQKWIESTNAIGLISKSGRYGGTFAHRDIAFEFASWISPQFKLYLITEFQRLKADENKRLNLEWSFQRTLAKVNYHIHTDAIV